MTLTQWKLRVDMALEASIKARRTITYDELARAAAIPSPHRIHKLTTYLEDILAEDVKNQHPLRAAVVISKARNGLPAPGFFDACHKLNAVTHKDHQQFHQNCLMRLFQ